MVLPDPPRSQRPREWTPARLTIARELRGLTRAQLANAIGKSAAAVGQFESGVIQPYAHVARAIASALSVPIDFLHRAPAVRVLSADDHFVRPSRAVTRIARRRSAAISMVLVEVYQQLTKETVREAQVPRVRLSAGAAAEFELIAEGLRAQWDLANAPIANMVALLEAPGIVVGQIDDRQAPTGSCSTWHGDQPWVLLAASAGTASQARIDAAHELGHLVVMHAGEDLAAPEAEHQADRFALAFLMPSREFELDVPTRVTQSALGILKRRWGVPMADMARRAHDLSLLSDASFQRSHARLNSARARLAEPDEPTTESPSTLLGALTAARDTGALEVVLEATGMTEGLLRELLGPSAV